MINTLIPWILRAIVFLSAFILFQIELISTQRLLPYFGGSFQVWSTSLVFFNLFLLLGYATVDYLGKRLESIHYPKIHFFVLILSTFFFVLKITPSESTSSSLDSFGPIIRTLSLQIGLPFYLLSMTLPLIQLWCSRLSMDRAYNLYFYSGLGSILGLVSYPLAFNIFLTTSEHWSLLSYLYFIFGILFIPVIFYLKEYPAVNKVEDRESIRTPLWIFGSFVTCFLMLAVTNIVSQLIGSIPLVWIIPLIIYMFSFMLVFKPWFSEKTINRSMLIWGFIFIGALIVQGLDYKMLYFALMLIGLYWFLFLACTIVNYQLYLRRPLTNTNHFNLFLNIGGLLATLFMTLIVPLLGRYFKFQQLEVSLSLFFLVSFLFSVGFERIKKTSFKKVIIAVVTLLILIVTNFSDSKREIAYFRNFYNSIRIIEIADQRLLVNGEILHGGQFQSSDKKNYPLHYYHPKAPFGDLMSIIEKKNTIGVVGLGIGSMAYYAQAGENWRFYEIDADMELVARNYFSYISTSKANIEIEIGDGRLLLKNSKEKFDLIVIDAFSGDAVPAHLITKEAIELYMSKLADDQSAIVFHVSNIFINLLSVIYPTSVDLNQSFVYTQRSFKDELGASNSYWCVMTKNSGLIKNLKNLGWRGGEDLPKTRSWRDDYISFIHPMYLMLKTYH